MPVIDRDKLCEEINKNESENFNINNDNDFKNETNNLNRGDINEE